MKLQNYYRQRYRLFTKYDEGILMDDEAWYSVTPEDIAQNIAQRITSKLSFLQRQLRIVDLFSCVGGDSIQQACAGHSVVSVDIDPVKLEMLQHNAEIYGVSQQIVPVNENVFEFVKTMKTGDFDVVIMSPPWGGPKNDRGKKTLDSLFPGLQELFVGCVRKMKNVVLYVPKDMDVQTISESVDFPFEVVQYVFGNHKVMNAIVTGVLIYSN